MYYGRVWYGMVWYGMILYVLWEGVGTIKWPPGQRRPASDVVCQPAKVRPKHKSANLVGLEEYSPIKWRGWKRLQV